MKQDHRKGKRLPAQLAAVNWHAAGIDIGAPRALGSGATRL